MSTAQPLRVFRWDYFLLAALSLSIGWGIRGNFGHEYGAMIPGCLTAIAVCLMSGRQDWRERVAYFAAFGALGWGFGGSMSYMMVIAYTHSGHQESQLYGFASLFVIGFLWAGMGGAGTAFPAVADRDRLTAIFKPLCWIFAVWLFKKWAIWPLMERWSSDYTSTLNRQESPLYWFDSDWTEALSALIAVCLYDLYERRFGKRTNPQVAWGLGAVLAAFALYLYFFIPVSGGYQTIGITVLGHPLTTGWDAGYAVVCATLLLLAVAISWFYPMLTILAALWGTVGYFGQRWIERTPDVMQPLMQILVQRQGDAVAYRETAGLTDLTVEQVASNFLINWPQMLEDSPYWIGTVVGIFFGCFVYFAFRGKFRDGASLFVYMSLGWLVSLILLPTLLGVHMTPPRGDDWAGILGVFLGTNIWLLRNRLTAVAWASWVSGILGGLAFAGAACLKLMMVYPGNPQRPGLDPATIEFWKHWQGANWHSFLEQSYGFMNGLAVAIALGLLATRVGRTNDSTAQPRRWTQVLAVGFVLFLLLYVNLYKNVTVWVNEGKVVPAQMRAPLVPVIEAPTYTGELFTFSAAAWFNLTWIALTAAGLFLLFRHLHKPLRLLPDNWLGRGQLLYLVFLWAIVIGNFERALTGFNEQRLITEWVIIINALVVTVMILTRPRDEGVELPVTTAGAYAGRLLGTIFFGLAGAAVALVIMTGAVRLAYGDHFAGHAGEQRRFGEKALWRTSPILKHGEHK